MKKLFTLIMLTTAFGAAMAQTADNRISIPINVTLNHYDGALGNEIFNLSRASAGFETGLKYYINPKFNLAGNLHFFRLGYDAFKTGAQDFDVSLEYKLNKDEAAKWKPFLTAGLGLFNTKSLDNAVIPMGAGVRYQFSESIDGLLESRYKLNAAKSGPNYLTTSIGLVFTPRSKKDSDGDGVPDRLDTCPNAAGSAATNGCPDSDGDGVADREDNCPQIAGLAKFMGCADTDNDGIPDLQDACPNDAGTAENKGCPDTDGDGILDKDDTCPNEAGTAANDGCPDTDGDGIVDKDDKCPNVAGLAANGGCPEKDTDNDGIIDKNDACPNTAGVASNNGCPKLTAEEEEVLVEALEGVNFLSGKDVLTEESKPKLDHVAEILNAHPTYKIKVSGYTDSSGNEASNLALSKKRATAVKDYLITDGVAANRIIADGFGVANPVADNSTREGRAKNRRVEFEIVFN